MKYRIADAVVDFDANRIERADRSVELEPRVAEVLRYLTDNAGRVVTREELLEQVWNTQAISDDAITRCVNLIRRSFDDNARDPRVLQTLTKRGYRLIAPVTLLDGAPRPEASPPQTLVRLDPDLGAFEVSAGAFVAGGAKLIPAIDAFLEVDMTRSGDPAWRWRGRGFSVSTRVSGDDLMLRVRRSLYTLALPIAGALLGALLAFQLLNNWGYGTEHGLALGQVIGGAVFAALLSGGLGWFLKDKLDRRAALDTTRRRDAILAAVLRG